MAALRRILNNPHPSPPHQLEPALSQDYSHPSPHHHHLPESHRQAPWDPPSQRTARSHEFRDGDPVYPRTHDHYYRDDPKYHAQYVQEYRDERPHSGKRRRLEEDAYYRRDHHTWRPTHDNSLRERSVSPVSPRPRSQDRDEYRHLDNQARPASSDLEDCQEVWHDELGNYILETHARQRKIETWYDDEIVRRNLDEARAHSHRYASALSSFQRATPSPPLDDRLRRGRSYSQSPDPRYSRRHSYSQDVVRDLDSILASTSRKGKGKRSANDSEFDRLSELDMATSAKPPSKRRRVQDITSAMAADDLDEYARPRESRAPEPVKRGGRVKGSKNKATLLAAASDDAASTRSGTPKGKARKALGSKKAVHDPSLLAATLHAPPNGFDRGSSPAGYHDPEIEYLWTSMPGSPRFEPIFYDLDQTIPPLKKGRRVEGQQMMRRVIALEEAQRKVWINIARKDMPKVYKYHATGYSAKVAHHKRLAHLCAVQARKQTVRTLKATKEIQIRAKKVMREMMVFWRKNERDERDGRKRAEKEALDRAKAEEERREAARQARKLEFLISQTELYSHFVGHKLKTSDAEEPDVTVKGEATASTAPMLPTALASLGDEPDGNAPRELADIDFDIEDASNLHRHAHKNAQAAVAMARQRAKAFDAQAALDRKTNEALALAKAQRRALGDADDAEGDDDDADRDTGEGRPLVDLDSEELNFQNPTSLNDQLSIPQPRMLMAQLKEYQLKGLNWLATLYEQGINGILADEMGLGKTVQSIALLTYLAETHDIWGPFLVIAPASTLHNWQQEISRFAPGLKALPYWGNVKDRATLRKFWNRKQISYNQDAPFHVLITSYPLVLQDEKYFQRVKWQYMILDEAQAIKNSSSARWKTLLGFHCRNRLLLTGTPIQNSMQELWALLHFIMPSLFDSHDEFSEWFSKDIENAAENKGSKLNEHQLRRLHMILKPFMLRRVKRHVQNELSEKIEIDVFCDLSPRQRAMYKRLRANISVAELLQKAQNIGDADSALSLMNLVMQFRKVCNHPELFERADVTASFSLCTFSASRNIQREGDFLLCPYSTRNAIEYVVPRLLYRDGGLVDVPSEDVRGGSDTSCLRRLMNIWSTDWIQRSVVEDSSAFSFLRLLDISPSEAHRIYTARQLPRLLLATSSEIVEDGYIYLSHPFVGTHSAEPLGQLRRRHISPYLEVADGLPALGSIALSVWRDSCLSRAALRWYAEPAVAPPISMYCADRTFVERQAAIETAPMESLAFYGLPPSLRENEAACRGLDEILPGVPPAGLFGNSPANQLPWSSIQVPEAKRLIYDSAKLARLDLLLQELKAGDHRVLIYFQMTKMIDLMEEYLVYRQYRYLRLDGSSKLEDRRDMVIDWQSRPDIFIFLLSTRAGGLGINLTAADTVIFYDHDWNPSNDAQAMDRAHRLGQTKQVTVYRLITRGTIDERIVQLARVKKDVQDIVVGNKQFTEATKPNEIVSLLLNDDELAQAAANDVTSAQTVNEPEISAKRKGKRADKAQPSPNGVAPMRDLWADEGDDFFGHSALATAEGTPLEDDSMPPPAGKPGRKRGGAPAGRPGRKPGTGPGRKPSYRKKPGPITGDTLPEDL